MGSLTKKKKANEFNESKRCYQKQRNSARERDREREKNRQEQTLGSI